MGINDRDYMRRRPEDSKFSQAKSSLTDFIQTHPVATAIIVVVVLAVLYNIWKG